MLHGTILEQATELLARIPLLDRMDASLIRTLAKYATIRAYHEAEMISSPGFRDHRLNIVEQGSVVILRIDEQENETVLAKFIEGESYGELDLLDPQETNYHVKAASATTVCSFPGDDIEAKDFFEEHAELGAEVAERLLRDIGSRTRSANALVAEKAPWLEGLKHQILTDKLTGLSNATYLREELPEVLSRSGDPATMLIVKPDNFKTINDTYGHDAGDAVLRLMAQTVRSFASGDVCARFKGDVFCVALQAPPEEVSNRARSLLGTFRSLELTPYTGGNAFTMTATIGLCPTTPQADAIDEACKNALSLVMERREEGGDSFAWWE